MEEEREWRGEGATGDSAAEDGEVRPPPPPAPKPPRRESEEERGGCSGGRLRARQNKDYQKNVSLGSVRCLWARGESRNLGEVS